MAVVLKSSLSVKTKVQTIVNTGKKCLKGETLKGPEINKQLSFIGGD